MYSAAGSTYDHLHLSVDGGAVAEISNASGTHTFNNVGAGAHVLSATLVDAAHNPLGTANSQVTRNFTAEDCFPDNFAPNCTVDTDGDGAPDSAEGPTADTDGDGKLDYLESSVTDADGDGTMDQADPNDADPCIPSSTGTGCPQPPPPPSSGGGSFSVLWLMALSGVLAIRRRRYPRTGK
jgi:MYXO-CTERM domain-containing protein